MVKSGMDNHHVEGLVRIAEVFSVLMMVRGALFEVRNDEISKSDGTHYRCIERSTAHDQDAVAGRKSCPRQ